MKNTGAGDLRPVHGSWRGDLRDVPDLLSRPMIGHTPRKLPPLGAISRFIAVLRAGQAFPHSHYIIKEIIPDVKRNFSVFYKISKIFLAGGKSRWIFRFLANLRWKPGANAPPPEKRRRACALLPAASISRPRPSRCRWCTLCRTRGTRPRCRSAPAACSGR